jgi:O-antigen/teichoic acid export membrane protein
MTGAYITIAGAIITVVLNIVLIPKFRYTGSAWATFICYAFMMIISYVLGQKYYTIPYAKKKLLTYLGICVGFYIIHEYAIAKLLNHKAAYFPYVYYGTSLLFMGLFTLLIMKVEKKEFERLPFIGKLLYKPPDTGLKTQ